MYGRTVNDRTLEFGHEGVLYRDSFVMYDRETGSLWVHTTGECVKGELTGQQLEFIPSVVTTWEQWRESHPRTTVLEGEEASGFMGTFSLATGKSDDLGVSVGQNGAVKLYLVDDLRVRRVVNDTIDGVPVAIFFDPETMHATAWNRRAHTFRWEDGKILDQSDQPWESMTGTPTNHFSSESALRPIAATVWLIEQWRGFYPYSSVYKGAPVEADL